MPPTPILRAMTLRPVRLGSVVLGALLGSTTRRGLTLSLESTTSDDHGDRQMLDDLLASVQLDG